ncbi:keratin-associated protein 16-1-like, partial [Hyposmocoma kahamanoa]|uniref:keratin-associated protein 16-1-like n=1 Tax=Hyposmocoma kahamanoa TaxID=1477025 RepID=UPI000E6D9E41
CVCNLGYRRKSREDKTCILAEECPPVNCTRPNEIWSSCPSSCLAESCSDVNNQPTTCNDLVHNCQPRCICAKGYFRNDNQVCVLAKECSTPVTEPPIKEPVCGYNEIPATCPQRCPPQDCEALYLKYLCAAKNESESCVPGCDCKENYLRNASKICVPIKECPPAPWIIVEPNPPTNESGQCGVNKTIVPCTFKCPNNFCPENDDLVKYACKPPRGCPSGCGCKDGYRYKSCQDDTCVLTRDCPPVTCTRPNEEWNSCPPLCFSDTCEDRNKTQSQCYESEGYCDPRCVCEKGYYRNANQTCVPACECG